MAKDFYVLRAGKVVYSPGHYDEKGAEQVARTVLKMHPKATVQIVRVVQTLVQPTKGK